MREERKRDQRMRALREQADTKRVVQFAGKADKATNPLDACLKSDLFGHVQRLPIRRLPRNERGAPLNFC
jgi:hypothetical protein